MYDILYITYLIAPRIPPGQVKGRVECGVWVLGGACGSARGGPGRALGGQLSAKATVRTVAKNGVSCPQRPCGGQLPKMAMVLQKNES